VRDHRAAGVSPPISAATVGAGTAPTRCDGVRGVTLSPHNLQSVDHEEDTCMKLRIGKCKAASKETRRC
jgi:hypothetical protein